MKNAVVIFSGGPDSTAAALWALEQGCKVKLLTYQFNGHEQNGELNSAMQIAKTLKLPHSIIDFKSPMSVFSSDVRVLMHADTTQTKDKTKPHRMEFGAGMILSTSAAYANYHGFDSVIWGANKDDVIGGKYEYTQDFANNLATLVSRCTGSSFDIAVPFAEKHKYQLFKAFRGKEDLFAETWSAKSGGYIQDGKTRACIARRLAAKLAGLNDLTLYTHNSYDFENKLTKEQMKDFSKISDEEFGLLFGSDNDPY